MSVARRIGAIALTGALAATAVLLLGAGPASAKTTTVHLFDKSVSSGAFAASGVALNPSAQAATGDYFVSTGTDYNGNHNRHSKKSVGASNLVCTITSGTSGFCDGVIAIGSSLLFIDHVAVNLSGNAPLKVTGGTGQYRGARGTISAQGVSNTNNNDFTIKITT